MPRNKTIYVNEEDAAAWDEAKRLLRFHHNKGLAAYITPLLREYIANEEAAQRAKKS
jgi:hypothetical protein